MKKEKPIFIGIVGPSGAGKSSLCKILKDESDDIEHIKLDNYFKDPRRFPKKLGYPNWELPQNLKFDLLLKHLKQLERGKEVKAKTFPKKKGGKRLPIILKPKKYILVEGFLLFKDKAVRNFLDKRIYLEIPEKIMLKRRAIRFGEEHINEYDIKVAIPEFVRIGTIQKNFATHIINANRPQKKVISDVKKLF
jgi:uridine kinase